MLYSLAGEYRRGKHEFKKRKPDGLLNGFSRGMYRDLNNYIKIHINIYMPAPRLTMRDEQDAMDLTQEVYLAVCKNIGS